MIETEPEEEEDMSENKIIQGPRRFVIRLRGLQTGASPNDMIPALRRLMPHETEEKIHMALRRLPLILTRAATEEQTEKIKRFLESKGAILEITPCPPAAGDPLPTEEINPSVPERAEGTPEPPPSTPREAPQKGDRRTKPRVHPGIQLHPMGIGEILDRAFRLLRQSFWLFFFILLIPQGIFFLVFKVLQMLFREAQTPGLAMGITMGISFFIAIIIFFVLQCWAQGSLIHAVSETYLGHTTSLSTAYGSVWRQLFRLVGTVIIMVILMLLAPVGLGTITAVLIYVLSSTTIGKLVIVLLVAVFVILALLVFFHLFLDWLMVDKVVVLEGKAWLTALRRSKEIMRAHTEPGFWRKTKMKAGLILLLGFLIGIGIHILLQIPGVAFHFLMPENLIVLTIHEILNMVATCLVTAFTAIAMLLFYYDIRLRKEGFDLKMMAENL